MRWGEGTLVDPNDPWARATSRIRENLEMLARQIVAAKPGVVWTTTSKNDVKPIHIVISIGYPADVDRQLVFKSCCRERSRS